MAETKAKIAHKTDKPAAAAKSAVEEPATKFKGKYIEAVGRRKSATARVRLFKTGKGLIMVNGQTLEAYLTPTLVNVAKEPLKQAGTAKELDFSIIVNGGGKKGQAGAIRHGIARTLVEMEPDLRLAFKAKDFLTRDARIKERKKPGLKKARKAPQWAKR
jgi:small subunit ribosomal protein S9